MIQPRAEALMTASAIIRAHRDGRQLTDEPIPDSLVETSIASLWTLAGCDVAWIADRAKAALHELGMQPL